MSQQVELVHGIPIVAGRVHRVVRHFERRARVNDEKLPGYDLRDDCSSITASSCASWDSAGKASEYLRGLQKFNKSYDAYPREGYRQRRALRNDAKLHDRRKYSTVLESGREIDCASSFESVPQLRRRSSKRVDVEQESLASRSSERSKSSRASGRSKSSRTSERSKSSRTSGRSKSSMKSKSSEHSKISRRSHDKRSGNDINKRVSRKELRRRLADRFSIVDLEGFLTEIEPDAVALLEACRTGDEGRVVALHSAGVDINASLDANGASPFIVAVLHRNIEVATALYGLGANIEAKDNDGNTALCCAARSGDMEVFTALMQIGASVTATNNDGDSVLVLAARNLIGASKDRYDEVMSMCQTLVEMEKATVDHVPTAAEIGDEAVAFIVEEWVEAKCNMKDLHIPPLKIFRKGKQSLEKFFKQEHQKFDYYEVAKVGMLLLFIAYDFVSAGLVFKSWSFVLYVVLYMCAYML